MLRIMMLLVSLAMMRCLRRIIRKANIISEAAPFAEGKHHSKIPLLPDGQKWDFCWSG